MAQRDDSHERASLIPRQDAPRTPQKRGHGQTSPTTIVFLLALWVLCAGSSDELVQPPQLRVLENIYCRIFFANDASVIGPSGNIPEELCKNPWVQQQVASLKGWQLFFDCVPALLLAIPFGWFADKYGRKPLIMMLSISFFTRAAWIQFIYRLWPLVSIRLVWLSALHSFCGGSNPVASAIIFVIMSDVTKEIDRAKAFMYVGSCMYATALFAPPLSAILMERNPWIPMLLGLLLQFLCIPVVLFVPETLGYLTTQQEDALDAAPPLSDKASWSIKIRVGLRSFTNLITSDTRIPALLVTFLVHTVINASNPIMLQYLSARYDLTIATSTLIISIRSAAVVVVLLLLPVLSRKVISYTTMSALRQDLLIARASALIGSIAYIAISLSPSASLCIGSLLVSTAGSGLFLVLRSVLLALVAEKDAAKILSATSVIDILGLMIGGPSMAAFFGRGLELGRKWMGLPFLGCAFCLGIVAFLLFGIQANHSRHAERVSIDEDYPE